MADVMTMFDADYLSAAWLQGRDVTLTISKVVPETLEVRPMPGRKAKKPTERKPVLYFTELEAKRAKSGADTPFMLICNKTNAKAIGALYGRDADAWAGKRVTLYPAREMCFGELKDVVRVRPAVPAGKSPPKKSEPEPESRDEDIDPSMYEEAV